MKAGIKALELIKEQELLKLEAYLDTGKVLTIGYGHTGKVDGKPIAPGDRITEAKADGLLALDVLDAERTVNRLVYVPLTQNQFDALVSFVFNIGTGQFRTSKLLGMLNKKDYLGASNQFRRWVYDNKVKLAGLVKRRNAEKKLFDGGLT